MPSKEGDEDGNDPKEQDVIDEKEEHDKEQSINQS